MYERIVLSSLGLEFFKLNKIQCHVSMSLGGTPRPLVPREVGPIGLGLDIFGFGVFDVVSPT